MSNIKIGWGEEIFEFNKPISLVGQFAERISQYTEKPLTATAMAVETNGEQMILCSADLAQASMPLINEVRKRISKMDLGIDVSKIVISAIHTHTGPGYKGSGTRSIGEGSASVYALMLEKVLPPGKKYIQQVDVRGNDSIMSGDELFEEISSKIVKAICKAWENRKEAMFANSFGRAAVGMCRRVSYSDGSAQMWGDTNRAVFTHLEGGNDSGIELLYIFDSKKNLTGVVANLACPAQCVQHRHFISPDFWGEVKMLLREHFGEKLFLLPLCSAAGDQCPVDLIRFVEPESDINDPNLTRSNPPKRKADPSMFDLAGMKKAGRRIAMEIIQEYNDGVDNIQSDALFIHQVNKFELPLRRATLSDETNARKAILDYVSNIPGDVDYNDVAKLQIHLGLLRRVELQDTMEVVPVESHIIRFGDIAICTNPFELFLDYGNQIKARSKAEQTFIIQLANGSEGYLPTERAEKGGHYSAFISSGSVGHEGGELLVRETLAHINEMWK